MLHCLLNSSAYRNAANAGEMALYALLGFIVVCLGIALLIFVVWLLGRLMDAKTAAPKEKKTQETSAINAVNDETDEETVAVITAALMAYYQTANAKCNFIVKRIKKL